MFSQKLKEIAKNSPRIAILTGAGISAESGVPTFRGEDGIWKKMKPEELANFNAFMKNPELVWEWYSHRQELVRDVQPNAGHFAIAEMEKMCKTFYLITQNVDNLHKRAGSKSPIELHGNIMRNKCIDCNTMFEEDIVDLEKGLPMCRECDGMLRPDVVWFGEMLPEKALRRAEEAISNSDLFLSIGTAAAVQPAASMPIWAKQEGAYLLEINIEETPITNFVDEHISGLSGQILPQLVELLRN